jgi:uridine phosphorylase
MVVETVKKMDQVLEFYSDDGGYTTWTLSLNSLGIGSGSASASDIPASSFPVLN